MKTTVMILEHMEVLNGDKYFLSSRSKGESRAGMIVVGGSGLQRDVSGSHDNSTRRYLMLNIHDIYASVHEAKIAVQSHPLVQGQPR
ncbi:hypothetical protein QVD17_12821 [Tagetes erecta]|uniref:Uncharacterized protein n=1 Tax=Tagetes erecta TaxID=13708 RepID=A0AAD8NVT0_TARER|nr:hypothetical protein QVD17_12821 [Tagetes erecta]